ncbi:MAG: PAS domain-containing protein [Candidatus Korobacteraceae bacterium]
MRKYTSNFAQAHGTETENGFAAAAQPALADRPAGGSGSHQRLRLSFLFLAGFQLVLIGVSLLGWLQLENSYQRAMRSQQLWHARRQKITELESVAASSKMPGMEDFNSDDWRDGRQTMRYGANIFMARADAFAQDLARSEDALSQSMLPTARSLSDQMQATLEQADKVFAAFEAKDRKQFAAEMLYTDRIYRRVLLAVGELRTSAFESESSELKQQTLVAGRVRTWSFTLAVIAALLALALIKYAWGLQRQLLADEAQLTKHRSALEARVQEATVELRDEATKLNRAESAIRRSEAHLAEAQRIAHFGTWEWDVRSGEMFWSDETYRLLGFAPNSRPAHFEALLQKVSPTDREHMVHAFQESVARRVPLRTECRIHRPHGGDRVLLLQGEIENDESGNQFIAGFTLDITDRKLAQELMERQAHEAVAAAAQYRRPIT